ncbi:ABC transporter substrate-binding protein [Actinomadura macrotermitis]|uniref:Putative D,D-dipeptide-binding periplasmic protein DdpA n=1 Tax=Actinomadura macrotermitis TaxID=2585200 RepID=A0A7K0C4G3_9ACTN|nr:ABC transporter substrate-binding protein [Actinomadura macrotermitis]MQY08331.1 putative D,D-dipeptide-binding periplasmic protein DdpA [Actinomadura macrotermitis]
MPLLDPLRSAPRGALAAGAVAAVLALSACGGGQADGGSLQPVRGGTLNVLRTYPFEGFELDKESLNATYLFSGAVLEPLLRADPDGRSLRPGLASSWSFGHGNRTLTLKLDPKAAFSDGKPVTAADVAFSIATWKAGPNYGATYSVIRSTKTIDDRTIALELSEPDTSLPSFLAWATAGVVPKDFGGRPAKQFWQKPVGAGPYTVSDWSTNGKVVLTRNTHYYRAGLPYTDQVVSTYAGDQNSIGLQLASGQADLANEIFPVLAATLPKKQINSTLNHMTSVLLMNTKDPALADVKVRQAIGYAIDYASVVGSSLKGYGAVPTGALPTNVANWAPPSRPYFSHDAAKAKALLAGASRRPATLTMAYPNDPSTSLMAQIVQQNLKDLGITVNLQAADAAGNYATVSGGKYQLALFAYNAISPDASDPVVYLGATGTMFTGHPVGAIDAALGDYRRTTDAKAKQAAITKVQDALLEEAPFVALGQGAQLVAQRTAVHGLRQTPWGGYDLATIWKNK